MKHVYDYQENLSVGRVSLEMSLKPFKDLSDEGMENACRVLFEGWKPLLNYASSVAVMFWTADGSEILEYAGDLNQAFNWCSWIGIGNPPQPKSELSLLDRRNLHKMPFPYEGPEKMHDVTFGDLKRMIAAVKKVGKEITGTDVQVIETFDPGPEFAYSDFKFNRHREISKNGKIMGAKFWVDCAARLCAEDHVYAAYPNGIPEGTPFGEFLGKQFMAFKRDLGFDGIWLSNGFGFSKDAWNWKGLLFDGEKFDFTNAQSVRAGINDFWKTFTAELDDTLIETRGSNLSTGMDISAHGCPIDDIYTYNMLTPPNSPWAALDSRFGLELCGYLSHIAETSENGFLFRYYTHDPWWQNSPWFDRYGRSPHDIYLPLSLARMDGDGKISKPYGINFLSADDSFGNLPEKCPIEVIPHILEGFNNYSDAAGFLTWIYPFDYYCKIGLREGKMDRMLMDDWFIEAAIDLGLPVNTVISDKNFATVDPAKFSRSVLMTPVPEAGSDLEKCVFRALDSGCKLMLYGSTEHASDELKALIGVRTGEALSGTEFTEADQFEEDVFEVGEVSRKLIHIPLVSGGGLTEEDAGTATVIATVSDGTQIRPYVTFNAEKNLVWVRGSFPHDPTQRGALPAVRKPSEVFPCARLLRQALSLLGTTVRFRAFSPDDKLPLLLFSACRNGYYQTMFAKDTTVTVALSTPYGAPVAIGTEAIVEKNVAYTPAKKWENDELRVFIKQENRSRIICRTNTPDDGLMVDRRIQVEGLSDATVTFFAPPETLVNMNLNYNKWVKNTGLWNNNVPVTDNGDGTFTASGLTGTLEITWQSKEAREELLNFGY